MRNPETKGLAEVGRLLIKDKDIHSLEIGSFANLIIEDKYLISQSRIFYLNSPTPLMNGILDMEDLSRSSHYDSAESRAGEESVRALSSPRSDGSASSLVDEAISGPPTPSR